MLFRSTTVILGLDRKMLAAKLVPYPANKANTTGAVIPFVETCHCGPIPTKAITKCLLVCSADCSHFHIEHDLGGSRLAEIEAEFEKVSPAGAKERAEMMQRISKQMQSPEFQARMRKAREAAERARRQAEGPPPDGS